MSGFASKSKDHLDFTSQKWKGLACFGPCVLVVMIIINVSEFFLFLDTEASPWGLQGNSIPMEKFLVRHPTAEEDSHWTKSWIYDHRDEKLR